MTEVPGQIDWSAITAEGPGGGPPAAVGADGPTPPPRRHRDHDRRGSGSSARWALAVFVVWAVAAFFLLLLHYGRYHGFYLDEWDFLAARKTGNLSDYFRDYNGHWSTLPIVVYRFLYGLFGVRQYWPYQLVVVSAHLAVVALLRVVMRRAGAGPWVATVTAGSLLLFGAGGSDIIWAFQMSFTGAVALGLADMVLADHDGGLGRRDVVGLAAGLGAIMCSGVGIAMVAAVGLAVLCRRGWRAAAFHVIPLAGVYVAWWLAERPVSLFNPGHAGVGTVLSQSARFVGEGIGAAFSAFSQIPFLGFIVAAVLVGGLLLAWLPLDRAEFRRRSAMPGALLLADLTFLITTAGERWYFGPWLARDGHYVYVVVALALPAGAVAAAALIEHWRPAAPLLAILVLVGVPGNLDKFTPSVYSGAKFYEYQNLLFSTIVHSPLGAQVPASMHPYPQSAPAVTAGWLRGAQRAGRLATTRPAVDPQIQALLPVLLGIEQSNEAEPTRGCATVRRPVTLSLRRGERFGVSGGAFSVTASSGSGRTPPVVFTPDPLGPSTPIDRTYIVELDDGPFTITPVAGAIRLCR